VAISVVSISASGVARNAVDPTMTKPEFEPQQPVNLAKLPTLLRQLHSGLIVSCQAAADEPLYGSEHMAAMAVAAASGGAVGIRANSPKDIAAIRLVVSLPIIGIYKLDIPGYTVRITPTIESAFQVAQAGADIIAIDATSRQHPDGLSLLERVRQIHEQTHCPVMADVSTYDEGLAAEHAGADLVSTTLSGYSEDSPAQDTPDFDLLQRLVSNLHIPVVVEGRIANPEQAARALALGAFAVVVGSAITRPQWITARFVQRMVNP
jgi:N-acylglucosamine-6-phosphate 2-epimerase